MYRITFEHSSSQAYEILIRKGAVNSLYGLVENYANPGEEFYIIIDSRVLSLYSDYVSSSFPIKDILSKAIVIPSGERHKNLQMYEWIISQLLNRGMRRRSVLITIGGGVIMDLGGFVAATFMRGVPVVNIPTTLIAQVDASIGGKVAVNCPEGKNLVGAFYNPKLVVIDPFFLSTLETMHIRDGLAEIIKTGVIGSSDLFDLVENRIDSILKGDLDILEAIIKMTAQVKMDILKEDPYERNLERRLNFGHTIGHPLETLYEYQGVTHGMAVGIGMSAEVRYAMRKGFCKPNVGFRILNLIAKAGIPTTIGIQSRENMSAALKVIERVRNGCLNLVLPTDIGETIILNQADYEEIITLISDDNISHY